MSKVVETYKAVPLSQVRRWIEIWGAISIGVDMRTGKWTYTLGKKRGK